MNRQHLGPMIFLLLFQGGCGSKFHMLDKGHVTVSGLQKPIPPQAASGGSSMSVELQSRQSALIHLPAPLLEGAHWITISDENHASATHLLDRAAIPSAGATALVGKVLLERGVDRSLSVHFIAGEAIRAGALAFGDNHLRVELFADAGRTYTDLRNVKVSDFSVAGVMRTFFASGTKGADGDFNYKGWISDLTPLVPEAKPGANPTFLHVGWYPMVNP